ncbi:MAG: EAL domain-containing protein [Acidobacteria bacterium]|nr:EAL domain-containing protein [Acidobacteriota bacterium]
MLPLLANNPDPGPRGSTLDRVAALVARLLQVPAVGVYIGERPRLQLRGSAGSDGSLREEMRSVAAWVPVTRSQPMVCANLKRDDHLHQFAPSVCFCAAFAIPLWDGGTAGVLVAADVEPHQITPNQIRDLTDLAVLAGNELELEKRRSAPAMAPERRRTQEQLLEKSLELAKFGEDLRQLHRLSTTNYETLDELFHDYLETGRNIFGLGCGVISQVRGRYAVVRASRSDSFPVRAGMTFELSQLYCGEVFEKGRTISCHWVGHNQVLAGRAHYGPVRQSAYIGAPILVDGDLYGVLSFSSPHPRWREFSSHETELIELMAKGIGRSILEGRMQGARERSEALERDRSLVLEMVAKDQPLASVLRQIARMMERQSPALAVTIHLALDGKLYCAAAPSMPEAYGRRMQGTEMVHEAGYCYSAGLLKRTELFTENGPQCRFEDAHEYCWQACATAPILTGNGDLLGLLMVYWKLAVQPRTVDEELLEMACSLAAIAIEHRRLSDRMAFQANHDALTGLANRALLTQTVELLMETAARENAQFAVVYFDLDRFKQINDHLGHAAGDAVLCEIAARVREKLRPGEIAARLGGDEFVAVLTEVENEHDAVARSEQILDSMRAAIHWNGQAIQLTASAGVTLYPQGGTTAESVLANADAAMYRAKHSGRNSVQCHEREWQDERSIRLRLEHSLHDAVDLEQLRISFQPIWDIRLNEGVSLESFEVLIWWEHPELGRIPPSQFIPIAEECGHIGEIGRWTLREACRIAARAMKNGTGPFRIAVNVSARQFAQPDLAGTVLAALSDSGLSPELLELELTESVIMECIETAAAKMERLRACGVRIALDDFGTGYSSLGYLRWIPVDTLKIDQSFTSGIGTSASALTLVQTILSMAHNMNLSVVAEGVETEHQLEMLRSINCDRAQGHLFGRPIPARDLESFLRTYQEPLQRIAMRA